ncbi:hypothetical protein [Vibrio comitans]|uniref:hypothetical protein n=1 Tax=Vibrio comitans TaxID=413401 RepID=UPI0011424288|nr:hypothetical protein [Vibrio comitans]
MRKSVFGATLLSLLVSSCSLNVFAEIREPIKPKSKQVIAECELQTIESNGDISFSEFYQGNAARFKVRMSENYQRVELKLDDVQVGDLSVDKGLHLIRLQLDTPDRYEGDANYWRRGVELNASELGADREIDLKVRVDLPVSKVTAGDHEIRMKWSISCG